MRRLNRLKAASSDLSCSGIANPKEFRPETAPRPQMRELGTTEMVITEELSLNVAPLPRIGETKDFDCNSIANAQSRTMASKETHF